MKKLLLPAFVFACVTSVATTTFAQSTIGVGDVFPGKVEYAAFSLGANTKLDVRVTGGAFHHEDWRKLVYYGWIIDSETRKPVWHTADKLEDGFEYGEFQVKDEISLKPETTKCTSREPITTRTPIGALMALAASSTISSATEGVRIITVKCVREWASPFREI